MTHRKQNIKQHRVVNEKCPLRYVTAHILALCDVFEERGYNVNPVIDPGLERDEINIAPVINEGPPSHSESI